MEYFFLIALPFISGSLSIFLQRKQAQVVRFLLTVSGGFLFGTVMLHLFPEVFEAQTQAGIFIVIGFFIQLILEKFSEGVEHGHLHLDLPDGHDHGHDLRPLGCFPVYPFIPFWKAFRFPPSKQHPFQNYSIIPCFWPSLYIKFQHPLPLLPYCLKQIWVKNGFSLCCCGTP
jgi:hypothetical protein